MDRFSILDQLNDNWPGKYPQSRIAFIEKQTRDFSTAALDAAITQVIRTEQYPPNVASIVGAARARNRAVVKTQDKEMVQPGGPVPGRPDERFLTVDEMAEELKRLREDEPLAFDTSEPPPSLDMGDRMKLMINRIYARGLERGIRGGGRPIEAIQPSMF